MTAENFIRMTLLATSAAAATMDGRYFYALGLCRLLSLHTNKRLSSIMRSPWSDGMDGSIIFLDMLVSENSSQQGATGWTQSEEGVLPRNDVLIGLTGVILSRASRPCLGGWMDIRMDCCFWCVMSGGYYARRKRLLALFHDIIMSLPFSLCRHDIGYIHLICSSNL